MGGCLKTGWTLFISARTVGHAGTSSLCQSIPAKEKKLPVPPKPLLYKNSTEGTIAVSLSAHGWTTSRLAFAVYSWYTLRIFYGSSLQTCIFYKHHLNINPK
jgi:hypothetical protein